MRIPALLLVVIWGLFAAEEGARTAPPAEAAQRGASAESGHGGGHEGGEDAVSKETLWKIVNFVILAGGLGYLIAKSAPAFFRARTAQIQRSIQEAARMREEAEARAAGIEQRMKNLGGEIEQLRQSAAGEIAREGERVKAETERQAARIRSQGQQEISAAAKSARQELRGYASDLATQLAAEKIKAQMTPQAQDALLEAFVRDLERRRARPEVH